MHAIVTTRANRLPFPPDRLERANDRRVRHEPTRRRRRSTTHTSRPHSRTDHRVGGPGLGRHRRRIRRSADPRPGHAMGRRRHRHRHSGHGGDVAIALALHADRRTSTRAADRIRTRCARMLARRVGSRDRISSALPLRSLLVRQRTGVEPSRSLHGHRPGRRERTRSCHESDRLLVDVRRRLRADSDRTGPTRRAGVARTRQVHRSVPLQRSIPFRRFRQHVRTASSRSARGGGPYPRNDDQRIATRSPDRLHIERCLELSDGSIGDRGR